MTFAENEIVSLFLSLGILLFFLANLRRLRELKGYKPMLWGFYCYLSALIFTLLETVAWTGAFNFLEHLGYFLSAAFLAVWIAQVAGLRRGVG
jgi:hypothetical protein